MCSFVDDLIKYRDKCFICFKSNDGSLQNVFCKDRNILTVCQACHYDWSFANGWLSGRALGLDYDEYSSDTASALVEMLWGIYRERSIWSTDYKAVCDAKIKAHGLPEDTSLERSDLFYEDLFRVVSEFKFSGRGFDRLLEKYGYFGVCDKIDERLKFIRGLANAST